MNNSLKKIVVDLTPLCKKGENGGAKVFVLELIRQMVDEAKEIDFYLIFENADELICQFPLTDNLHFLSLRGKKNLLQKILQSNFSQSGDKGSLCHDWNKTTQNPSKRGPQGAVLFCPFSAVFFDVPGIPVVSTFYDLQVLTYPQFFSKNESFERVQNIHGMLRRAHGIACISDFGKNSILSRFDYHPNFIRTIYPQMGERINKTESLSGSFRMLPFQNYIFYPANFWPHKNHEALLVAFAMASRRGLPESVHLVLTGEESARMYELRKATETMGIQHRVHFLGYISNEEIVEVLKNSLALLFPSLYEGFGIPVVEAQTAGVPVACSSVTSLPEVAGNGALFLDPRKPMAMAEAIIQITQNKKLRQDLIQKGFINAKRFSNAKSMAKDYLKFFSDTYDRAAVSINGVARDGWVRRKVEIQNHLSRTVKIKINFIRPKELSNEKLWYGIKSKSWLPRLWKKATAGQKVKIELALSPKRIISIKFSPCNLSVAKNGNNDGESSGFACKIQECTYAIEKSSLEIAMLRYP